ncbi:MAG TPA: hypothetical protein VGM19_03730 [Armatimonadota bacterium]|jgi:hypothetical protein
MDELNEQVSRTLVVDRLAQLSGDSTRHLAQGNCLAFDVYVTEYNELLPAIRRFFPQIPRARLDFIDSKTAMPTGWHMLGPSEAAQIKMVEVTDRLQELHRAVGIVTKATIGEDESTGDGPLRDVLPRGLTLPKALTGHRRMLDDFLTAHPYHENIFVMAKYRNSNLGHRAMIENGIRESSLYPVLADKENITDDLYNPIACLLCCKHGVALFDAPEPNQEVNPNVAYELGHMHLLGRDSLVLKSKDLSSPPTDVLQKLYKEYDESNLDGIRLLVREWAGNLPS